MRPLALMMLFAAPVVCLAAPVPKELRRGPPIVGTWAITGANVNGTEQAAYNGQRWTFGADGSFSNPAYRAGSYDVQPGGIDLRFSRDGATPWLTLADCDGTTLKIAFPRTQSTRATDFVGANNNVVYTFQRVKE